MYTTFVFLPDRDHVDQTFDSYPPKQLKQNEGPCSWRWEMGNAIFTVLFCPVLSPNPSQMEVRSALPGKKKTPKTDLSITDTSSWDYRSQSMSLSLSLNCSTRKSRALTPLLLKNYWHRDCSSFSHPSCRHHIYTRNGRSAERQHAGRWADKEV